MSNRTKAEQEERRRWWERKPLPVAVLGVDPGERAGAALHLPKAGVLWSRQVETNTRQLEQALEQALRDAWTAGCSRLLMVIEEWGRGGKMGIDQWLGLGAALGAWRRTAALLVAECGDPWAQLLTKTRSTVRVPMVTWRSHMFEVFGAYAGGKYRPFKSADWKEQAVRRCAELFPAMTFDGPDAAEAALIAYYGARSDEAGKVVGASW